MHASGARPVPVLICQDRFGACFELTPDIACTGFREMGVYTFSGLPDGAALYIDEARVTPVVDADVPTLRWQPGFYAGEVAAEVLDAGGKSLALYRLDVAPDERKLGADVYHSMLQQIDAFDPALLLGTEAAQISIGVAGDVTSVLLQYARLRRHADPLLRSLQAVALRPLTRLRHERRSVGFHRVRRIDPASARRLMTRPATAALVRNAPCMTPAASPSLEVMQPVEDADNPANRALSATLAALRLRCTSVINAFEKLAIAKLDEGARTSLAGRLERKLLFLQVLSARLKALAKLPPYSIVARAEVTAAGLTAISAHPDYGRAYRLGWAALRPGIAGPDRQETLWLSPTWEIYERWCYLRVVECLQEQLPQLEWSCRRHSTVDVIRHRGRGAGIQVDVSLQRTFQRSSTGTAGLHSVSLQLKPDILVTMEAAGVRRMLVLDAKYRTGLSNVLNAMRSAHLYQDALRWGDQRPACTLLLLPRGGDAPWLEAPEFHQEHRTGVHVLAPGQRSAGLSETLGRWFGDMDMAV